MDEIVRKVAEAAPAPMAAAPSGSLDREIKFRARARTLNRQKKEAEV